MATHVIDGLIDLSAGTAGGVACVYAGQPLDTVKVKMQTFSHLYSNSTKCFMETFRKDGIRGLYAGTIPALAANIAENSILFCAYGFCQKGVASAVRKESVDKLGPIENAAAGSLAAVFSSFALCPTELIKCKLQALRETQGAVTGLTMGVHFSGPWELTRQVVAQEGLRGMFKGLTPTFAREVPGYFFFFGGYEAARNYYTPAGKTKDDIGVLRTAVSGGIGGVSLWVAIFPADVIKSKVQVEGHGSFVATGLKIVKAAGVKGLYQGLGPTVIRSFFATGCLFVAYEWTKKTLTGFVPSNSN